jgi:hypothetical protein
MPAARGQQRRIQRSVRVSVAAGLLVLAAVVVVAAVVTSTWVSAAAVACLLAGATSSRIIYTEVTQTRRDSAVARAEQARDFGHAMTKTHAEHLTYTATMMTRLADRDQEIVSLNGTIRLAEKRADVAEARVKRESKRANDAQERLSALLEEVRAAQEAADQAAAEESAEVWAGLGIPEAAELPTVVDLLAWEERADEALLGDADELDTRRHA